MNTEFEIKFLTVDISALKEKIETLGGSCVDARRLLRRQTFDFVEKLPVGKRFIRVRDQGKIVITYKLILDKNSIDGVKESELVVDDFDQAVKFLTSLGYIPASYQENYRETWLLDNVEITIDEWPGIQPFIELEGKSAESVQAVAAKLGFDISAGVGGTIDSIYEKELGIEPAKFNSISKLTFEDIEVLGVK